MAIDDDEFQQLLAQAALQASFPGAEQIETPPAGEPVDEQPATATARSDEHGWCRANGCDTPLHPSLIDGPDGTGLHATCREPGPPASTVDEMRHALIRYDASRPRSRQTRLGPSELGTPCERQMALKLAGVQQRPRGLAWAPLLGTAVHHLMEDVLRTENERIGRERWLIEHALQMEDGVPDPVSGCDPIRGHGDAYRIDDAMVVDWKLTGTTARRKASRVRVPNDQLVSPEYRVQTHLYGYGYRRAGYRVRWVRVVMLARSHDYDESREWTEAYDESIAVDALARFHRVKAAVEEMDARQYPARLLQVPAAPGEACKWCPFLRVTPAGGLPVDATGCEGNTVLTSTGVDGFLGV